MVVQIVIMLITQSNYVNVRSRYPKADNKTVVVGHRFLNRPSFWPSRCLAVVGVRGDDLGVVICNKKVWQNYKE